MSLKREEVQAFIEREGVHEFLWARTWKDIEDTNIGLFEMANERWGCVFQIYPPLYSAGDMEDKLATMYGGLDIPDKSSIQFLAFPSRNLTDYRLNYEYQHENLSDVKYPDTLKELRENRSNWLKKHANDNIFSTGNDLRLRNFINIVAITIPKYKSPGIEYKESEIITYFSKVEQALNSFSPQKFTRQQYVTLMRELLIPDQPLWYPPDDDKSFINNQCVDNDSVMILKDNGSIGLGKMISEEKYKSKNANSNDQIQEKQSFFQSLFSSKNKNEEKQEAYTEWSSRVYTTKLFPNNISLFSIAHKFYDYLGDRMSPIIPCPFMLSLIVYYENREKIKTEIGEKVKWNLWQTQSLGQSARFFPEIIKRAVEAEEINNMLDDGDVPIYSSWCCVLMDKEESKLNEYGEILKKEFLQDNWVLQEETLIPHWIFLYHLPMNFEPYILKNLAQRMNTLFASNSAVITPVITGEKGQGAPVLSYTDRGGQVVGFDIFSSQTNYNFVVVGSSGSGKSYTMADFFSNYLMNKTKIRVIDVGRSYQSLCNLVGGQYIEFTEEASICLNFFTKVQTDKVTGKIHEDEMLTIVPLVALMAMQSVNPDDVTDLKTPMIASFISQAITLAWEKNNRNAGMQDVLESLNVIANEQKTEYGETNETLLDLIHSLYPFGNPDGEYYKYFNGVNNLDFENDFVVIELEEIDSKELLKAVVLAAVSNQISTEFFLGDLSQNKMLAIDEAWSIMDNKVVVRFLETMARRIRKYRGATGIITQSLEDFNKNSATQAVFSNSAWKILLQQSKSSMSVAEELFGESITNLLATVKTRTPFYSDIMAINDSGAFFISRLITDKLAHWIYTTHRNDRAEITQLSKEYGINETSSRYLIGYKNLNKSSYSEEYTKLSEAGKLTYIN